MPIPANVRKTVLGAVDYADQAQQWSQGVVALPRQREHTLSVVYAELYATLLSQNCRDVAAAHAPDCSQHIRAGLPRPVAAER
jgi:hypothetical protein